MSRRFASLVVDVDSTLSGIEGIDWLAERRGARVARHVRVSTRQAMSGAVALEAVYTARLEEVAPGRDDLDALASAYVAHLAPGAAEALLAIADAGVRVEVVSGGLRPAILPLAAACGVTADRVHAVDVAFDARGSYAGFDEASPLARQGGKPVTVRSLRLPRPALAVGDGSTDLELRRSGAVERFAAFAGFARRAEVVAAADDVVHDFGAVRALTLGSPVL